MVLLLLRMERFFRGHILVGAKEQAVRSLFRLLLYWVESRKVVQAKEGKGGHQK